MIAVRLSDGRLRIPLPFRAEDGTVGDGVVVVGPASPLYEQYVDEAVPEDRLDQVPAWYRFRKPMTDDERLEIRVILEN